MVKAVVFLAAVVFGTALAHPRGFLQPRAFAEQDYSAFRISDGSAGTAEQEAAAIFVAPFQGIDLASVSATDLDAVNNMARAAVDSEENFNQAIDAATDEAVADALQVGKIKNKVLKLTGEIQVLQIKQAQGQDVADDIEEEQTKLAENVKSDSGSAGEASMSFLNVQKLKAKRDADVAGYNKVVRNFMSSTGSAERRSSKRRH